MKPRSTRRTCGFTNEVHLRAYSWQRVEIGHIGRNGGHDGWGIQQALLWTSFWTSSSTEQGQTSRLRWTPTNSDNLAISWTVLFWSKTDRSTWNLRLKLKKKRNKPEYKPKTINAVVYIEKSKIQEIRGECIYFVIYVQSQQRLEAMCVTRSNHSWVWS